MNARLAGWLVVLVMLGACTEVRDEPPASLCERYAEAAERVQSRCSWRELNLVLEFPSIAEYYDPEITLGSILEDLRGKEGLDAYADRMRIVVEDFDTGFYAAFDPGD